MQKAKKPMIALFLFLLLISTSASADTTFENVELLHTSEANLTLEEAISIARITNVDNIGGGYFNVMFDETPVKVWHIVAKPDNIDTDAVHAYTISDESKSILVSEDYIFDEKLAELESIWGEWNFWSVDQKEYIQYRNSRGMQSNYMPGVPEKDDICAEEATEKAVTILSENNVDESEIQMLKFGTEFAIPTPEAVEANIATEKYWIISYYDSISTDLIEHEKLYQIMIPASGNGQAFFESNVAKDGI